MEHFRYEGRRITRVRIARGGYEAYVGDRSLARTDPEAFITSGPQYGQGAKQRALDIVKRKIKRRVMREKTRGLAKRAGRIYHQHGAALVPCEVQDGHWRCPKCRRIVCPEGLVEFVAEI